MVARFALALGVSSDLTVGMGNTSALAGQPDLKLTRRLRQIEELPQHQKKSLLLTIAAYLKSNRRRREG